MSRFVALLSFLSIISTVSAIPVSERDVSLQKRSTYTEVFEGSGDDHDASIQGWGYLTFTRLDTYDLSACEAWCDGVSACAFINLYNEFNTDATYNPQFKCVAYATPHTAAEKTNFGGQQLLPPPAGVSYITDSVGYTSDAFANPTTPDGYTLVFGPTDGATEADGLMETHPLTFYDTQGCADICTAAVDPSGNICAYFNIWLGVENGNPTYNCALYSIATDASTATNTGQGSIQVTNSRGYARIINLITDGGFEDLTPTCPDGCTTTADPNWSLSGQTLLVIELVPPHSGSASVIVAMTSSVTYANPLDTIPGKQYSLSFWLFGGPSPSFTLTILWNSVPVNVLIPSAAGWVLYSVTLTAVGNDQLRFTGDDLLVDQAYFIDDISFVAI